MTLYSVLLILLFLGPSFPRFARGQQSDRLQSFGGHLYEAVNTARTWNAAREDAEQRTQCSGVQGHLVSITSATEQDFVASLYKTFLPEALGAWIGLSDSDIEGSFQWVTNEGTTSFTNWAPGQPDNFVHSGRSENCVELQAFFFQWNDLLCSSLHNRPYIVEFDCAVDAPTATQIPTQTPIQTKPNPTTQHPTRSPTQSPTQPPTQPPTQSPSQRPMGKKNAVQIPTPPTRAPAQGPASTPTSQPTETETQAPSLDNNDDSSSRSNASSSSSSELGALGVLAVVPISLVGVIWYLWWKLRNMTTTTTALTRSDQRNDPPPGSSREDTGRSSPSEHRVGPPQEQHRHHHGRSTGGASVLKPTFKNQCEQQLPPIVSAILVANDNNIEPP
jgi:hypothetical protein